MVHPDPDYIPRADYDFDGKVDAFEMGMFLAEMEEEDKAIAEGKAFFSSAWPRPHRNKPLGPHEDYTGMDLESCTIFDPDYTGDESLEELVERYGIQLTKEDMRFYNESQGDFSDSDFDEDEEEEEIELDRDHELDARILEYQQRIDEIVTELRSIQDEEQEFIDNGEKYEFTDRYMQADNNTTYLESVISNLEDASFNLGLAGF